MGVGGGGVPASEDLTASARAGPIFALWNPVKVMSARSMAFDAAGWLAQRCAAGVRLAVVGRWVLVVGLFPRLKI